VNATAEKWKKHYQMYDYVVKELPEVLKKADLGLDLSRVSLMGHSMGGVYEMRTKEATTTHVHRPRRSVALPQEPRDVQVRFCLFPCLVCPLYQWHHAPS
jgi:hypothetical protein